jgi:hypothetical protein
MAYDTVWAEATRLHAGLTHKTTTGHVYANIVSYGGM